MTERTSSPDAWERYMERPRSVWDLVGRLQDPKLDEQYQRRILEILLTPKLENLGFSYNLRAGKKENLLPQAANLNWKTISSSVSLAAQIIRNNSISLAGSTDKVAQGARGYYSVIIANIFPSLSEAERETLFNYFQFDEVVYDPRIERSRDPLAIFYQNSDIPLKWKAELSARVHEKIVAQSIRPRTWSERLTKLSLAERYSGLLRNIEFGHDRQRGLHQLFITEVQYLLRKSALSPVFARRDELVEVLDDLKTSAVDREKLFILHFRVHGFRVNTDSERGIVREMLNVFSDDTKLVRSLKEEIKTYDRGIKRFRERQAITDQEAAAEAELNASLRREP